MARTPALRKLRRLAEEHRMADAWGVPAAEVREVARSANSRSGERRAELSRRELVKRGVLLGAGIAAGLPAWFARPAHAATSARVAIVGGGIAGLTAALTLADKGVASTVYEASTERVGGRMHSDRSGYWSDGQISEFCGELIDTGHQTIRHLAQRFRLDTVDLVGAQPNGTDDTFYFLGGRYFIDDADNDFKPIHNTLQGQVQATGYPTTHASHTDAGVFFDQMSVYDWIENYVPGGHASRMGRLLDAAYAEEYGAQTTDQAALNLMYLLGFQATPGNFQIFGASDERFHIVGGNQRLPEAIRDYLPADTVRMGWSMRSIRTNADGTVALRFSTPGKPQTVTADHVILCMSFAVLRTLDYSGAGFDPLKIKAITELGAGRNAKLQLQFDARYWNTIGSNGNLYSDLGIQNTWEVSRAQPGTSGVIVDYSGGDVAAAYQPSTPYSNAATNPAVVTYANDFLARLETAWPGISQHWNGKATLSTPWRDELLNCSYSYWKPGQYVGFSGYEGVAQGRIHFAGEHCSQDFQGYMEGGAAEGVRAANEILAALK
jgi:monoamine oxidase